jgi:hypothetical protein
MLCFYNKIIPFQENRPTSFDDTVRLDLPVFKLKSMHYLTNKNRYIFKLYEPVSLVELGFKHNLLFSSGCVTSDGEIEELYLDNLFAFPTADFSLIPVNFVNLSLKDKRFFLSLKKELLVSTPFFHNKKASGLYLDYAGNISGYYFKNRIELSTDNLEINVIEKSMLIRESGKAPYNLGYIICLEEPLHLASSPQTPIYALLMDNSGKIFTYSKPQ